MDRRRVPLRKTGRSIETKADCIAVTFIRPVVSGSTDRAREKALQQPGPNMTASTQAANVRGQTPLARVSREM